MGRYPCGVCGRGVGANFVLCRTYGKWCHKKCLGLRNLRMADVSRIQLPACAHVGADGAIDRGEDMVGEEKQFYNFGIMLDCRDVQKNQ